MPSFIKRPHKFTIEQRARAIIKSLFATKSSVDGYIIKYDKVDIIKLLNNIGQHKDMRQDMRFAWGDALLSLSASKQAVHTIGVRGTATQHHNKQAIVSSQIVLDENTNIMNKKWIQELLPHKSKRGKDKYLSLCHGIRKEFDIFDTGVLCIVKDIQRRNSLVVTALWIKRLDI